jgi:hypothetical protein
MLKKRHKPEEIVAKLRQVDRSDVTGKVSRWRDGGFADRRKRVQGSLDRLAARHPPGVEALDHPVNVEIEPRGLLPQRRANPA